MLAGREGAHVRLDRFRSPRAPARDWVEPQLLSTSIFSFRSHGEVRICPAMPR
jgi:hypothetical protein